MSLTILVNGETQSVPVNCTLVQLLTILQIEGRLAIDVNGEIIPRSSHNEFTLSEADRVEIVHAIGGGAARSGFIRTDHKV